MAKTEELPGMPAKKVVKAIEGAAADYFEKRNARQDAGKLEKEAKTKLIELMHKNELTEYKFEFQDDEVMFVELKPTEEKLKVKIVGEEEADEEDSDE